MSTPESCLPDAWMQRIFAAMRATYGVAFDRQWESPPCPPGVDPQAHVHAHYEGIKAHWARELGGYVRNPDAIRHALAHLPDAPPALPAFKALLARAPVMAPPALPAPQADPQAVAAAVGRAMAAPAQHDPKAWAHRLLARVEAGERLPHAHVQMARQALRLDLATPEQDAWRAAA